MAKSVKELNAMVDEILAIFRQRILECSDDDMRRILIQSFITNPQYAEWTDRNLRFRFEAAQTNGQLVYGPPFNWRGEEPERGSEVFVSGLDGDICAPEIIAVFQLVGRIFSLRMMMEFSGNLRGFCYVRYSDADAANFAVDILDGFEYRRGRHMIVRISIDNCRLFIGNIPKNLSPEDIEKILRNRTDNIETIITYTNDENRNRGFCFVNYSNHTAATTAKKSLIASGIPEFLPNIVAVDWATPERQLDRNTIKRIKIVFIRNVSMRTTENDLRNFVEQYIRNIFIVKVKRLINIAFVHFTTHRHAQFAVENLNGLYLDGNRIEVAYAKPADVNSEAYIRQNLHEHQEVVCGCNAAVNVAIPEAPQNEFSRSERERHQGELLHNIPEVNPNFAEGFRHARNNANTSSSSRDTERPKFGSSHGSAQDGQLPGPSRDINRPLRFAEDSGFRREYSGIHGGANFDRPPSRRRQNYVPQHGRFSEENEFNNTEENRRRAFDGVDFQRYQRRLRQRAYDGPNFGGPQSRQEAEEANFGGVLQRRQEADEANFGRNQHRQEAEEANFGRNQHRQEAEEANFGRNQRRQEAEEANLWRPLRRQEAYEEPNLWRPLRRQEGFEENIVRPERPQEFFDEAAAERQQNVRNDDDEIDYEELARLLTQCKLFFPYWQNYF